MEMQMPKPSRHRVRTDIEGRESYHRATGKAKRGHGLVYKKKKNKTSSKNHIRMKGDKDTDKIQQTLFDFQALQKELDTLEAPEKPKTIRAIKTNRTNKKKKPRFHQRPCQWCGKPIKIGGRIEHWEKEHMDQLKKISANGYKLPRGCKSD